MRNLILILVAAVSLSAQTSNYPGSLDTDASLFVTADNIQSTLSVAMGTGDNVAIVASSTGFLVNMIATVCDTTNSSGKCTAWEHMKVTGVSGNILTVTRGVAGSSARAHSSGKLISVLIDSAHQAVLADAVKKMQAAIGLNPVSSGATAAVSVPTATGVPAVLGAFVDGSSSSPQASNTKSSVIFQRVNALPANIATAFTFDCASTSAAGADLGCITVGNVIHDLTAARGGTATRNTVYADASAASAAIVTASLSAGVVTVTTGSAHLARAGGPVTIGGTSGMTGLNSTVAYTVATVTDSTHFTIACGGCSGGPGSGGTATIPVGYFASWNSVFKVAGPQIRVVGEESDMNNQYGDAGSDTSAQDATFNYASYCSSHNCTVAHYIGSGDGTAKYYYGVKFAAAAIVDSFPYFDTSAGPTTTDFAWVGNNQFMRWADSAAGRWPVLGMDTTDNFRISAPTGHVINMGANLASVLLVGGTVMSNRQSTTLAKAANYIASETGANNAIAGALTDALGTAVPLIAGLQVTIKLAHTLQAGADTFNLNAGGAVAIKSGRNVSNNIGTAYAATGTVTLFYDGTEWVDVSQ